MQAVSRPVYDDPFRIGKRLRHGASSNKVHGFAVTTSVIEPLTTQLSSSRTPLDQPILSQPLRCGMENQYHNDTRGPA